VHRLSSQPSNQGCHLRCRKATKCSTNAVGAGPNHRGINVIAPCHPGPPVSWIQQGSHHHPQHAIQINHLPSVSLSARLRVMVNVYRLIVSFPHPPNSASPPRPPVRHRRQARPQAFAPLFSISTSPCPRQAFSVSWPAPHLAAHHHHCGRKPIRASPRCPRHTSPSIPMQGSSSPNRRSKCCFVTASPKTVSIAARRNGTKSSPSIGREHDRCWLSRWIGILRCARKVGPVRGNLHRDQSLLLPSSTLMSDKGGRPPR